MLSVTEILWKIYPYNNEFFLGSLSKEWIDKKRSKHQLIKWWIADKGWSINYDNLMDHLTAFWSSIHLYAYMKWTWLWDLVLPKSYLPYTAWLDNFFRRYQVKTIVWEHYIKTEKYHWTFDALVSMIIPWNTKPINVLIDFKTWKYYKDFYWIENIILRRDWTPYFNKWSIEKVRLQLSLYKDWWDLDKKSKDNKVDKLWVVRVTKKWTFLSLFDYDITEYKDWLANPNRTSLNKKVWRI